MKFHIHKYERIGKLEHLCWDYSGIEVLVAECKCTICGKRSKKKFMGRWQ